jgi:hypothetical protein
VQPRQPDLVVDVNQEGRDGSSCRPVPSGLALMVVDPRHGSLADVARDRWNLVVERKRDRRHRNERKLIDPEDRAEQFLRLGSQADAQTMSSNPANSLRHSP